VSQPKSFGVRVTAKRKEKTMNINPEEEINRRAENVSREDVKGVLDNEESAEKKVKRSGFLKQYWADIKTSFALLRDWYLGNYKKVPFRMVAAITGAIIYLMSPIDIVPDIIPFGGLLDDALVLAAVFGISRANLDEYIQWANRAKEV